jgi:hypothetical protein
MYAPVSVNFDIDARDRALRDCIAACRKQGIFDPESFLSLGVGLVALGLSVHNATDGCPVELEELRDLAIEGVKAIEPADLRAAA